MLLSGTSLRYTSPSIDRPSVFNDAAARATRFLEGTRRIPLETNGPELLGAILLSYRTIQGSSGREEVRLRPLRWPLLKLARRSAPPDIVRV